MLCSWGVGGSPRAPRLEVTSAATAIQGESLQEAVSQGPQMWGAGRPALLHMEQPPPWRVSGAAWEPDSKAGFYLSVSAGRPWTKRRLGIGKVGSRAGRKKWVPSLSADQRVWGMQAPAKPFYPASSPNGDEKCLITRLLNSHGWNPS